MRSGHSAHPAAWGDGRGGGVTLPTLPPNRRQSTSGTTRPALRRRASGRRPARPRGHTGLRRRRLVQRAGVGRAVALAPAKAIRSCRSDDLLRAQSLRGVRAVHVARCITLNLGAWFGRSVMSGFRWSAGRTTFRPPPTAFGTCSVAQQFVSQRARQASGCSRPRPSRTGRGGRSRIANRWY